MLTSPARPPRTDPVRIDDLLVRMRHLVDSAEPAIVFSSLVRVCVPMFCDVATVDIVEGGRVRYRIDYPQQPLPGADALPAQNEVVTRFSSEQVGWASYTGVMRSRWLTRPATAQDEARAAEVIDCVIDMIRRERLADPVRSSRSYPAVGNQHRSSHR